MQYDVNKKNVSNSYRELRGRCLIYLNSACGITDVHGGGSLSVLFGLRKLAAKVDVAPSITSL